MIPNNNPLYNTKDSRVQRFAPFVDNIKKEKDDLKKVARQNRDDKVSGENTPHSGQDELHWNTLSNKMDNNLTKSQIEDRIKSLEEDDDTKQDHKYKVVKSFENFQDEMTSEPEMNVGHDEIDYENESGTTSYMFFNNLETIHNASKDILSMDQSSVNQLLNDGHNWAEDHISIAKENLSHVYNFMMNHGVKENHSNENYMFFGNIESIHRMCEDMMGLNDQEVDEILTDGHDWAEDHMSAAKECITQVEDFLKNEL